MPAAFLRLALPSLWFPRCRRERSPLVHSSDLQCHPYVSFSSHGSHGRLPPPWGAGERGPLLRWHRRRWAPLSGRPLSRGMTPTRRRWTAAPASLFRLPAMPLGRPRLFWPLPWRPASRLHTCLFFLVCGRECCFRCLLASTIPPCGSVQGSWPPVFLPPDSRGRKTKDRTPVGPSPAEPHTATPTTTTRRRTGNPKKKDPRATAKGFFLPHRPEAPPLCGMGHHEKPEKEKRWGTSPCRRSSTRTAADTGVHARGAAPRTGRRRRWWWSDA